jgi:hypothetical protein
MFSTGCDELIVDLSMNGKENLFENQLKKNRDELNERLDSNSKFLERKLSDINIPNKTLDFNSLMFLDSAEKISDQMEELNSSFSKNDSLNYDPKESLDFALISTTTPIIKLNVPKVCILGALKQMILNCFHLIHSKFENNPYNSIILSLLIVLILMILLLAFLFYNSRKKSASTDIYERFTESNSIMNSIRNLSHFDSQIPTHYYDDVPGMNHRNKNSVVIRTIKAINYDQYNKDELNSVKMSTKNENRKIRRYFWQIVYSKRKEEAFNLGDTNL